MAVFLSAVALQIVPKVEFNFEVLLYITILVYLSPGSCSRSVIRYQNSISKHTHRSHVIRGCRRKEKFFTRKVWKESALLKIPFWGHLNIDLCFSYLFKSQRSNFSIRDDNKTFEVLQVRFGPQYNAPWSPLFSNTVIGWSYRVRLGAEEHKQWCDYRRIFLASRFTRALVYCAGPTNPPVVQIDIINLPVFLHMGPWPIPQSPSHIFLKDAWDCIIPPVQRCFTTVIENFATSSISLKTSKTVNVQSNSYHCVAWPWRGTFGLYFLNVEFVAILSKDSSNSITSWYCCLIRTSDISCKTRLRKI